MEVSFSSVGANAGFGRRMIMRSRPDGPPSGEGRARTGEEPRDDQRGERADREERREMVRHEAQDDAMPALRDRDALEDPVHAQYAALFAVDPRRPAGI